MMSSGAPITGKDRRPLNKAGMDIRQNPYRYGWKAQAPFLSKH
jgi:hypothetical protein